MLPIEIDWDGVNLPEEMRQLPPGRYVANPVDDADELTKAEDAGIRHAMKQIEDGEGLPPEDVMREIRSRERRGAP